MENLVTMFWHSFFKGKKVLVTGHTGFKGAWLIELLTKAGAQTCGFALPPSTTPSLFNLLHNPGVGTSVLGDINDVHAITNAILMFQPEIIFHLAAQPLVRTSYACPAETFQVNAIGTLNVLEALRALPGPCTAILVTTDKIYQNNESGLPFKEEDPLGGHDPYSASKACAEIIIESYRKSFFPQEHYAEHKKSIVSVRSGNVIGGGDWATDRLIPDIARSLCAGDEVYVRNPSSVRPWLHILDTLHGYLLVAAKAHNAAASIGTAFNFSPSPDNSLTVLEMAQIACQCWGKGSIRIQDQANQPHEAKTLMLNSSKARQVLGWKPVWDTRTAIQAAMEWYSNYYRAPERAREFTQQQIERYYANLPHPF